jgi:hypothetical protein
MRGPTAAALALAAGVSAAALLGACGGSTKTVSVAGAPSETQTSATVTAPTTKSTAKTTTAAPAGANSGGTSASTTRTSSAPAFTQQESPGQAASAAAAVVRSHGYTPTDSSQYHASQTLRVLVATRTGSGDGYGQRAFFFVDGRYIGTDTSEPSAKLRVVSQSDTQVTLAYPLYRAGDALCCPSHGQATVSFQLDNGKLAPLQPIPPARERN